MTLQDLEAKVGLGLAVCILEKELPASFWESVTEDQRKEIIKTALNIRNGNAGFVAFMKLSDGIDWRSWLEISARDNAPDYIIDAAHVHCIEGAVSTYVSKDTAHPQRAINLRNYLTIRNWESIIYATKDESLRLIAVNKLFTCCWTPKQLIEFISLVYRWFLFKKLQNQSLPFDASVWKDTEVAPYLKIVRKAWEKVISLNLESVDWQRLYDTISKDCSAFSEVLLQKAQSSPRYSRAKSLIDEKICA